jgi:plastocyanin
MTRRSALCLAGFVLALMVPLAPARAGGFCHGGGNTQKATTQVAMKGNCFTPTVVHVDVGDKVTWSNLDQENHIVLGVGGSWGTPEIEPEGVAAMRFERPGVYPYWCHIHLGMVGAVVVGDGLPAASSGESGGDGPIATLEFSGAETAAELAPAESKGESTAPAAAAAAGIDWAALALAGVLIAATAAFVVGGGRLRLPVTNRTSVGPSISPGRPR